MMASSSDKVRSLARGLQVLAYLNKVGAARASHIASALGIPRPTVYRLLHTLEEEGYVLFSSSDGRARVTVLAAALGDNSSSRSRICHAAEPVLAKFTDTHGWPVDLSTYSDARMVIQESTHNRSSLSVDSGMIGFELPLLRSSAGRAYLAASDAHRRATIINILRNEDIVEDRRFLMDKGLDGKLDAYAAQGFATRGPRSFRPKTSSLAVPVMTQESVAGCLSIIWVTAAMTMDEAISRYAGALRTASEEISRNIALAE